MLLFEKKYRALLLYKVYSDLRAEAARYYMSFLWWVLDPVLTMVVFYIVFDVLFERGGPDFVEFLLIAIVMWQWFANTVTHSMNSIYNNGKLIGQVNIPKLFFPLVVVLSDLVKFVFVFLLLMGFLRLSGYGVTAHYLLLPVLLMIQLWFQASVAVLFASLVPFLPDMRFIIQAGLQLTFFLSGVFYSVERVPEVYRAYFYLNPMATMIDSYRAVLLYQEWPKWGFLGYVVLVCLVFTLLGRSIIRRNENAYVRMLVT